MRQGLPLPSLLFLSVSAVATGEGGRVLPGEGESVSIYRPGAATETEQG